MSAFGQETMLHWGAVGCYIAGVALFAYAVFFARPAKQAWALSGTLAGLALHSGALVLRYVHVGHGPYLMRYEVLSSQAWILVLGLVLYVWRRPNWAPLALFVLPVSVLIMGYGLFTNPEARDLPPTLRSTWLVFHVLFNKLAAGAFLASVACALLLLLRLKGKGARLWQRMPSSQALEAYTLRFIGFGFLFWTTTIGAGAIWANQSWGRYWGWDPIETWSLVTWLAYALLLHARFMLRLQARATAWGTLGCFGVSVLTILVFPYLFQSLHASYLKG